MTQKRSHFEPPWVTADRFHYEGLGATMMLMLIAYAYMTWRVFERATVALLASANTRIFKDTSLEPVTDADVGPEERRFLTAAAQQLEPLGFQPGRLFRLTNNRGVMAYSWVKPGEPSYGAQFLTRQLQPPRVLVQEAFSRRCHLKDGREIATGFTPMPSVMPRGRPA